MPVGITHEVKQGEHLSSIAQQYGFPDYKVVWNHAQNADLKQKRKNPNVLFPGDQVFIPDKNPKDISCPTDNKHNFQVSSTPLFLKLQLLREYDDPFANTPCELVVETQTTELKSDGQGTVKQQIARDAHTATLTIHDKLQVQKSEIPFDRVLAIKIGDLDPIDERSGQLARLANLGYYLGSLDQPDDDDFKSAVEEFQCEHDLKVDGICGSRTQDKLKQVHGC